MDKNLKKELVMYCKLNEITYVDEFIEKCTKDGFVLDKYGVAPFLPKSQIQEVPIEKDNTIKKQKIELDKQEDILEHFKKVTVNRRTQYLKTSNLEDTYLD